MPTTSGTTGVSRRFRLCGCRWPLGAAVLAELFHLLGDHRPAVNAAWRFLRSGVITVLPITDADLPDLDRLMKRYDDRPMDCAATTLVHLAKSLTAIFTSITTTSRLTSSTASANSASSHRADEHQCRLPWSHQNQHRREHFPAQHRQDPHPREFPQGMIPLQQRAASAAEVANAILFLASDEASYITGTEMYVDGHCRCFRGEATGISTRGTLVLHYIRSCWIIRNAPTEKEKSQPLNFLKKRTFSDRLEPIFT